MPHKGCFDVGWDMLHHFHAARGGADRGDGCGLHPTGNAEGEGVGKGYDVQGAAEILGHLVEFGARLGDKLSHKAGVGPTELVDVLVIVSDSDEAHVVVMPHESTNEIKFVGVHILGFVDEEDGFADAVGFDLSCLDHLSSLADDMISSVEVADTSEEVEAVGMKSFDFDEVSGVADEIEESLLELGSCCTGEGEHEELLVFHFFKEKE